MKMIFLSLAMLNLAYFGYYYFEMANPAVGSLKPGARVKQVASGGVQTIYLLNENSNDEIREQELDFIIKNPLRSEAQNEGELCVGVGPFSDLFAGQSVVEQLLSLDLNVQLKAVDHLVGESDYRIMIPPTPTLQDAFRKLRELKSQNIDSYVITQGKDALGISLGVFSSRAAATAAKDSLESDGYESVMVEIPRLNREFWIFDTGQDDLLMPGEVWQNISDEHPELQQKEVPCLNSSQIDQRLLVAAPDH